MTELIYLNIPISVIIICLVEILKDLGLPRKFAGLMSVVLGLVAGGIAVYFSKNYDLLFLGFLSGLVATGLFSSVKNTVEGIQGK